MNSSGWAVTAPGGGSTVMMMFSGSDLQSLYGNSIMQGAAGVAPLIPLAGLLLPNAIDRPEGNFGTGGGIIPSNLIFKRK
jgi:hypothetical protein